MFCMPVDLYDIITINNFLYGASLRTKTQKVGHLKIAAKYYCIKK